MFETFIYTDFFDLSLSVCLCIWSICSIWSHITSLIISLPHLVVKLAVRKKTVRQTNQTANNTTAKLN